MTSLAPVIEAWAKQVNKELSLSGNSFEDPTKQVQVVKEMLR